MKRYIIILHALLLLLIIASIQTAIGEGTDWICPNCSRTNSGNFCPDCGTKKPLWVCPVCGFENMSFFCENCGTAKPLDSTALIGTWKFNYLEQTIYITIKEDKQCEVATPQGYYQGNYAANGSSIVFMIDNQSLISGNYSISGDQMTFDLFGAGYKTDERPTFSVRMDGHSMDDTLNDEDMLYAERIDASCLQREDIVCVYYPGRGSAQFIKRLMGLPGDTIELRDGYLYINGEKYEEPYINDSYRTGRLNTFEIFRVPAKGDPIKLEDGYLKVNGEAWWGDSDLTGVQDNGDKLELKINADSGKADLLLNGKTLESAADLAQVNGVEFSLMNDFYFVMGDHRNNSNDSRSIGPLPAEMIFGHVLRKQQ